MICKGGYHECTGACSVHREISRVIQGDIISALWDIVIVVEHVNALMITPYTNHDSPPPPMHSRYPSNTMNRTFQNAFMVSPHTNHIPSNEQRQKANDWSIYAGKPPLIDQ